MTVKLGEIFGLETFNCGNMLSRAMRKLIVCIWKNKGANSFAVTAKLISAFGFINTQIVQFLLFPNPIAIFCACTAWFLSNLVGNPFFFTQWLKFY